jgi:hypothetical protein
MNNLNWEKTEGGAYVAKLFPELGEESIYYLVSERVDDKGWNCTAPDHTDVVTAEPLERCIKAAENHYFIYYAKDKEPTLSSLKERFNDCLNTWNNIQAEFARLGFKVEVEMHSYTTIGEIDFPVAASYTLSQWCKVSSVKAEE